MTRIELIQKLIRFKNYKRYLEIGVFKGECFLKLEGMQTKIGVDPNFLFGRKARLKYKLKNIFRFRTYFEQFYSDNFFEKRKSLLKKGIDIALVDGLHTYEQSYIDVVNILLYLSENGVIIMHDCYPPHKAASTRAQSYHEAKDQKPEGWSGEWCGDVWKAIVRLRSQHQDVSAFVIDTDYGLGVVVKGKPSYDLKLSLKEIDEMSYDQMKANPKNIIGLISPQEANRFFQLS